ncbi:hypothetical protein JTB14_020263 [Gonioctena quinquepunctata]|nr:hypothetical protein JTB14_020263 [Gonioctena quinquepunctata]
MSETEIRKAKLYGVLKAKVQNREKQGQDNIEPKKAVIRDNFTRQAQKGNPRKLLHQGPTWTQQKVKRGQKDRKAKLHGVLKAEVQNREKQGPDNIEPKKAVIRDNFTRQAQKSQPRGSYRGDPTKRQKREEGEKPKPQGISTKRLSSGNSAKGNWKSQEELLEEVQRGDKRDSGTFKNPQGSGKEQGYSKRRRLHKEDRWNLHRNKNGKPRGIHESSLSGLKDHM